MISGQARGLQLINTLQGRLGTAWLHYWQLYSSVDTWRFWFLMSVFVLPLIVLYLRIDRTKALQLAVFGFSMHVWLAKLDEMGVYNGLWNYRYTLNPFLTSTLFMDASLAPVMFMFVYQWTLNRNRNFYLYGFGSCFALAFVLKPALVQFGFVSMKGPICYVNWFLIYVFVMLVSKWTTSLFVHFQNEGNIFPRNPIAGDPPDTQIIRPFEKEKSFLRRRHRTTRRT